MKYVIFKSICLSAVYLLCVFPVISEKLPKESKDSSEIILFDGKTLKNWQKTDFAGKGEIRVNKKGNLVMEMGAELSGLHWKGEALPQKNYEITLQARRTMGSDFFCGLTFPFHESHATLVLGGWGGSLIGISSIDDFDASENETGDAYIFEEKKWYDIRLKVVESKILVWIDQEKVIDCDLGGKKLSMRPGEIEMSIPLGITTYATTGEFRKVKLRKF